MNPTLAHRLVALYPRTWRDRYQEEFEAFLEAETSSPAAILNIIRAACKEHVSAFELDMTPARRLTLLMYACLAAMTAGVNLYWTIDDTTVGHAMRTHGALATSWRVVTWGSAAAFVAAISAAAPILRRILDAAVATRRYGTIARLAVPFCALATLVGWMSIVVARTHWAPMPWDITGTWVAPASWPSPGTRWILGIITGCVIVCGLGTTAIALRQAVERAEPPDSWYLRLILSSLAVALTIMAAGALAWGALAQLYVPAAFHSNAGGIFGSTIFASWIVSVALFLGAASIARHGVRSAAWRGNAQL